jgi:hypothetical protein
VENPRGVSSELPVDEVLRMHPNVLRSGFPGVQTLIESSRNHNRTRDVTVLAQTFIAHVPAEDAGGLSRL